MQGVKKCQSKKFKCSGRGHGEDGCGVTLLVSENNLYHINRDSVIKTKSLATFFCPECGTETTGVAVGMRLFGKKPTWEEKIRAIKHGLKIDVIRIS